jgi:hypothetical protein
MPSCITSPPTDAEMQAAQVCTEDCPGQPRNCAEGLIFATQGCASDCPKTYTDMYLAQTFGCACISNSTGGGSSTTHSATTTGSTAAMGSTTATARVKSTQVLGTVTMQVPNCAAFVNEPNSSKAVKEGLKNHFVSPDHESKGVTLTVTLSCTTSRRLSDRQLAAGDLLANYVIDVPAAAAASGVDVNTIKSTIGNAKPAELTSTVTAAVKNYGFKGSYQLTVSNIAAPTLQTVYDATTTTARQRDSSTRALTVANGWLYLVSLMLISGLM